MTNYPKEWSEQVVNAFTDDFPFGYWDGVCSCCTGFESIEEQLKEHLRKSMNDALVNSRSRFKEEVIKALEKDIHYEESQIEDAVQEREGGTEGEIEESEIKIKALKEAIETIESL